MKRIVTINPRGYFNHDTKRFSTAASDQEIGQYVRETYGYTATYQVQSSDENNETVSREHARAMTYRDNT